jgi:hypothetical protein
VDRNRHPADRLHEVREEIKALETERDTLRSYLMEHPQDLAGDEYQASVALYQRRFVDWAGLERAIGRDVLQQFTRLTPITVVRLRERRERAA